MSNSSKKNTQKDYDKWYHVAFHISPVQFVSATSEETPGFSTGFCFDILVRSHQMPFLTIFSWNFLAVSGTVSYEDPKKIMFISRGP